MARQYYSDFFKRLADLNGKFDYHGTDANLSNKRIVICYRLLSTIILTKSKTEIIKMFSVLQTNILDQLDVCLKMTNEQCYKEYSEMYMDIFKIKDTLLSEITP
jgi:hypothetical protein